MGKGMRAHAPMLLAMLLGQAPSLALAHAWYGDLYNRAGVSCCADRDCHPVPMCILPTHREGLLVDGACRPIPHDAILSLPSPDGEAHACWEPSGKAIRCVILPGET